MTPGNVLSASGAYHHITVKGGLDELKQEEREDKEEKAEDKEEEVEVRIGRIRRG